MATNNMISKYQGSLPLNRVMSSWKDSSDFASLAAALSQAKGLVKPKDGDIKKKETFKVIEEEIGPKEETPVRAVHCKATYTDFTEPLGLPITNSLVFKQHKSTVSALEFESSGSRFLSGSHDTTVAYWDFNGMVKDEPAPFRFIEPMGSYTIRSLKYSKDSQWVLMAASSCCTKLFDRNGSQVREFGKGDPYIRDLKLTSGHVAGISTALWLPHDSDRFLTASEDGTLRIWHMGYRQKSENVIVVKSSVAGTGGRSPVTAATFSSDLLLTGSADGSIKLWDSNNLTSNSAFPIGSISKAHVIGEKICSLAFSRESNQFASRGTDGTVKLWDRRNLASPVNCFENIPTMHPETCVIFSHDKIITGSTEGLVILDPIDAEIRRILPRSSPVVSLAWNDRTDQILLGSSNGSIEVLYDPDAGNKKGVLLMKQSAATSRLYGEADISAEGFYSSQGTGIYDPSTRAPSKRKLDKIRSDPIKTHRPELPSFGPGQGGKIGSNVTQTIMKSVLKDTSRDVDPRAALLSYAERAANNPKFVATAYQETQPEPVFDVSLLDKEVAIEEEKRRKLEEVERLKAEKERINNRFNK